ncbi:MAG TPA: phospholipase, partial [Methylophaga aminisulfidivorans]|nr:phospholipase [Methylophaga aminisulfidivorans]
MKTPSFFALLLPLAFSFTPLVEADDKLNQCLLTQLSTADDTLSVGEIRQLCDSTITQNTIED